MTKIKTIFFTLLLLLAAQTAGFAAENYSYSKVEQPSTPLKGQVVYVPYGVTVPVVLSTSLSSETSSLGSNVTATLSDDFSYNGILIAPKGSVFEGTIIDVKKAGRANKNAQLAVKFHTIRTPQNFSIPISAVINTTDKMGILKGGTAKDGAIDYAKNTGIGAGGGAVLGTALGALSGGSVGLGAVYGTALGAGLGVIKATVDKGNAVEIPANSVVEIYFNQPITTAPNSYQY